MNKMTSEDSARDAILMQAVGEIKEATKSIAETEKVISANLKTLNDDNVLHKADSAAISKDLKFMKDRQWWLIIGLLLTLLAVLGIKNAIQYFF